MGRSSVWSASLAVVLVVAAVGCSDDNGAAPESDIEASTSSAGAATSTTEAPDAVTTTSETAPSSVAPTVASTEPPPTAPMETVATVPEQGVPGIDSANPFCRGWSEFAGSFQTLAFASLAGADPVAAARLEVVASAAVTSAAQMLADTFPDSVAAEREVFLDGVIGPFARRAGRLLDELVAAGLSVGEIEQLGDLWLTALIDAGVDGAEIVVVVPDELTDAVDAAAQVVAADVPPISADPSLVTQAEAPATFGYLTDNCPDQGILAGNDAVD